MNRFRTRIWQQLRLRWALVADRPVLWATLLALGLVVAIVVAIGVGSVEMGPSTLLAALFDSDHPLHAVLWQVRLPRIVGGILVGGALAIAGALLQTVVRNPLADPGLLGVTAGAGVAALIAILVFPERSELVPFVAFAGGLGTIGILLGLAWSHNHSLAPLRLVLSGVALQALFFSGSALLTFAFADRAPAFAGFIVGSLSGFGWADVRSVALPTILGLALALLAFRPLNLLLLDDATAGGLGLGVRGARLGASCLSALLAAGAVSVAGLVGFVGLVVPNAVRLLVGPDHRLLLPLAMLAGALLMISADTLARTALSPLELPVGALLAFIGGPYFLYLLWRKLA